VTGFDNYSLPGKIPTVKMEAAGSTQCHIPGHCENIMPLIEIVLATTPIQNTNKHAGAGMQTAVVKNAQMSKKMFTDQLFSKQTITLGPAYLVTR
jgi:hypothetical protein